MNLKNYGNIDASVRLARLEYTVALAEIIADGILATWHGCKVAARFLRAKAKVTFSPPASYSTSLRPH